MRYFRPFKFRNNNRLNRGENDSVPPYTLDYDLNELNEVLRDRIKESGVFISEVDQKIALDIMDRLQERYLSNSILKETYKNALRALNRLVPRFDQDGHRWIANNKITPAMEATIASRLNAQEIDIAAQDGSWGKLPEIVKEMIAITNPLQMELTGQCTVRCSFCSFSHKGPIQEKASFQSVLNIMRYFKSKQRAKTSPLTFDVLYHGTDPFDAKWSTADGEQDYYDLAQEYWQIMRAQPRVLMSSTAIPLGEEMRVLRFANELLVKKRQYQILSYNILRISLTNYNAERVASIVAVLQALHEKAIADRPTIINEGIIISNNRNAHIALRGKYWEQSELTVSLWDILGPNCFDGCVISPNSVDAIFMQAASEERPHGQLRFPIENKYAHESHFIIPKYHYVGDREKFIAEEDNYPDPTVIEIRVKANSVTTEELVMKDDPHRAFARVILFLQKLSIKSGGDLKKITLQDKWFFYYSVRKDIKLISDYLAAGNLNKTMMSYLQMLRDDGFIPTNYQSN